MDARKPAGAFEAAERILSAPDASRRQAVTGTSGRGGKSGGASTRTDEDDMVVTAALTPTPELRLPAPAGGAGGDGFNETPAASGLQLPGVGGQHAPFATSHPKVLRRYAMSLRGLPAIPALCTT